MSVVIDFDKIEMNETLQAKLENAFDLLEPLTFVLCDTFDVLQVAHDLDITIPVSDQDLRQYLQRIRRAELHCQGVLLPPFTANEESEFFCFYQDTPDQRETVSVPDCGLDVKIYERKRLDFEALGSLGYRLATVPELLGLRRKITSPERYPLISGPFWSQQCTEFRSRQGGADLQQIKVSSDFAAVLTLNLLEVEAYDASLGDYHLPLVKLW